MPAYSYSDRLPSDILSGCHSKFFSNSLDPSFAHTATSSSSHPQPSPFHQTTPNLKQLARSVQMANLQAEKNAVPQSPTLVKLLAAKDDKVNFSYEDGNDDFVGKEDVGWLMPAPAPAEPKPTTRHRRLALEQEQTLVLPLKKGLKRSVSSSSTGVFANHRQVEFGKAKEMKDKRAEIALMRTGKGVNPLRPFASSVNLVNAHQQTSSLSTMASSLGAKNLKTISAPLKKNAGLDTNGDEQSIETQNG
jgi:hypothetical protein